MAVLLQLSSGAEEMQCALSDDNARAMVDSRGCFEAAARLLSDLGWAADDARAEFAITISADRLMALLDEIDRATGRALVGYAEKLHDPASPSETPIERCDRLGAIREYCDQDLDMRNAALALRATVGRAS